MPTGKRSVVIQLVIHIPAEHTITEARSGRGNGFKLIEADVLPPDNSIYIRDTQFYTLDTLFTVIGY